MTPKQQGAGREAAGRRKRRNAGKNAAKISRKNAASTKDRRPAILAAINQPNSNTEFYTDERCWILEVCRDRDVTVARARVAPGVTTKAHSLRGVVERYLIIEGQGIVMIGGKAPEEVGPGDVVTIPPQVSQKITNTGTGDLIFYCICTPPFTQGCYKSLE